MDQVTASTGHLEFDSGRKVFVTDYRSECGCNWRVDMWGNVRTVEVCGHCNTRWVESPQLTLPLVEID